MAKKTPTPRGKARYTRFPPDVDKKFEAFLKTSGATGSSAIAALVAASLRRPKS